MERLIGRIKEKAVLQACMESDKPELIAIYGRRRVGKTFLVRNTFRNEFDFYCTGIYESTKREQLRYFNKQLCDYSGVPYPQVDNWFDAFDQLRHYLSNLKKKARLLVFIDEMPWMDAPRSGFLKAFEVFWNGWGSDCSRLKMIVCGSATTWIMSNLFGAKGGLYNRVTCKIKLQPFTLGECEAFLQSRKIVWSRYQMVEAYMIFGGVPFYLEMIPTGRSLPQVVDELLFTEGGQLRDEFTFLFRSLFKDAPAYRAVIDALGKKAKGLPRQEIQSAVRMSDGGRLTEVLQNLCDSDFIRRYESFGMKERGALYQLTDFFTLFNIKYLLPNSNADSNFWSLQTGTPEHSAWSGYAFEQVCLHHISQIKQALGISGVRSDVSAWTCKATEEHAGTQIDLVINRRDNVINLCEMKYASAEYEITKAYREKLIMRRELFRNITKTRSALHITMVTTNGVKHNENADVVNSEVTLDDLFKQ